MKSLLSVLHCSEISPFYFTLQWNLPFLFNTVVKSLLSILHCSEISPFYFTLQWNLPFLFYTAVKSLLSILLPYIQAGFEYVSACHSENLFFSHCHRNTFLVLSLFLSVPVVKLTVHSSGSWTHRISKRSPSCRVSVTVLPPPSILSLLRAPWPHMRGNDKRSPAVMSDESLYSRTLDELLNQHTALRLSDVLSLSSSVLFRRPYRRPSHALSHSRKDSLSITMQRNQQKSQHNSYGRRSRNVPVARKLDSCH